MSLGAIERIHSYKINTILRISYNDIARLNNVQYKWNEVILVIKMLFHSLYISLWNYISDAVLYPSHGCFVQVRILIFYPILLCCTEHDPGTSLPLRRRARPSDVRTFLHSAGIYERWELTSNS